jgi:four helix bundle protein
MALDHERLEVCQIALEFLVLANQVIESLPRGRGHLADQLTRASISIVLNIAEGAGKFSKMDKRRYYLSAVGSSTECAAILDVCLRLRLTEPEIHGRGKALLERVVSMLVRLAKNLQQADREGGGGERERVRDEAYSPPSGGSTRRS